MDDDWERKALASGRWPKDPVQPSDPATSDRARWPATLTPELRALLGLMCFELGPVAHVYQSVGEYVADDTEPLRKRAEDEQAFMLHKLIGFWFEHGADWGDIAAADLERALAAKRSAAGDKAETQNDDA